MTSLDISLSKNKMDGFTSCIADQDQVMQAMNAFRTQHTGSLLTNYYFSEFNSGRLPLWYSQSSLAFLDAEKDFNRLYFFSVSAADLQAMLKQSLRKKLAVDFFTNPSTGPELQRILLDAGFSERNRVMRMRVDAIPMKGAVYAGAYATNDDADEIFNLLSTEFDFLQFDRNLNRESFENLVHTKQVFVHKTGSIIDGCSVFRNQGLRCDWLYWYCRPNCGRFVAIKLLAAMFSEIEARGMKSVLLWVERTKHGPTQLYKKLGFKPDGTEAHLYFRR